MCTQFRHSKCTCANNWQSLINGTSFKLASRSRCSAHFGNCQQVTLSESLGDCQQSADRNGPSLHPQPSQMLHVGLWGESCRCLASIFIRRRGLVSTVLPRGSGPQLGQHVPACPSRSSFSLKHLSLQFHLQLTVTPVSSNARAGMSTDSRQDAFARSFIRHEHDQMSKSVPLKTRL